MTWASQMCLKTEQASWNAEPALWKSVKKSYSEKKERPLVRQQLRCESNIIPKVKLYTPCYLQDVLETCTNNGWKFESNFFHHLKHKHHKYEEQIITDVRPTTE